jgi:hypothetical protein
MNKSRVDMTMIELALHNGGREFDDPIRERLGQTYIRGSSDEMPHVADGERELTRADLKLLPYQPGDDINE